MPTSDDAREATIALPRDGSVDSSLAFLREGYHFIGNRCRRLNADAFVTRLLLEETVCARGAEAAEVFYAPGRFTRQGALPPTVLKLLQDVGSVATLDGEEHRHRKAMFMSLMGEAALQRLRAIAADEWRRSIDRWRAAGEIELHREVLGLLCRTACAWAGVPLDPSEVDERTHELAEMVERSAKVGPTHWRARMLRRRHERWVWQIVERIRAGELVPPEGTAAAVMASHRDRDGALLPAGIAAVELINILRPIVAVSRFIVFGALALHQHEEWRQRVAADDQALRWFVHEVRRYYPFFPAVAGRVREPFTWRGAEFPKGRKFVLDLYGTDHDPRIWGDPERFRPERFAEWNESPYNFVPQGGGSFPDGHRCPGEWVTIALMEVSIRMLAGAMRYAVPEQDLTVDYSQMPALPASGFRMRDIAPSQPGASAG